MEFTKEIVCKQFGLPEDTEEAIFKIQEIADMLEVIYNVYYKHVQEISVEKKKLEEFEKNLMKTIFLN